MPELGFQQTQSNNNNNNNSATSLGATSPDSVILGLFSSASSSSVDRCCSSSASDHRSQSSLQRLAVRECHESYSSSGPDLDPNEFNSIFCGKVEKDGSEGETEDENRVVDSARSSFSRALKDCQVRRSEVLVKKVDRRRPASLDFNGKLANVTSSSPRFGVGMKNSVSGKQDSACPSPVTPNYHYASVGIQKGWSSERVPLHTNANMRNVNALLPFNNGKTLPSKWEDAERWIMSPVSGDGCVKSSVALPQRRLKAKSGPLGTPGTACNSMYSPAVNMFDGGYVGNLTVASPFTAGVLSADNLSIQCGTMLGGNTKHLSRIDPFMGRSVSVHGCAEMLCQTFLPAFHDEKIGCVEDEVNSISRDVSRMDMETQMSPERSQTSSPGRLSFSPSTPSVLPLVEWQSLHSSMQEARDVQVDERVTIAQLYKKHRARNQGRGSGNVDEWKRKFLEVRPTNWELSEITKSVSETKRDEARITAWENLQKAKAEAAIRKLEMKLEKKRSSSMDKIMNKLRSAQKKAQQMRSSAEVNQAHQVTTTSDKVVPFRRTRQISSLSGCFTCHAF